MAKHAASKPLSRSLKVYQRIAVVFVVVTFFLLVAVLYLSVSRATITVVPTPKSVSISAPVRVVTAPDEDGELAGVVLEQSFSVTRLFTLPSEGATASEAKAGGMVTLINETANAQPLIATTRLLSEEGVLFRLDATTTVPAGGQIEAIVLADQPGLAGEVGPTQFTIPGLPQSLQADIYAVSVVPMKGGIAYKRVLTEGDINDAVATLTEALLAQAKEAFASQVDAAFDGQSFATEVTARSSDSAVGAEVSSFTATITLKVTGVYYDVDADSQALAKDRFVGRSANEVLTLLNASDAIESVSVSFTPFWLQRVPTLTDHIRIVIEDPLPAGE